MIQKFVTNTFSLEYLRKLIDTDLSPMNYALTGSKILHRNTGILYCWGEQCLPLTSVKEKSGALNMFISVCM